MDEVEYERKKKKLKINKKNVSILGIVLLVLIILGFAFYFLFVPKVSLIGNNHVTVEYGNEYIEEGYKATYFGKDITDKVFIEGKVNNEKLGNYVLKYKVKKGLVTATKEREVDVVDTTKPTLVLFGEDEKHVCPGKEYTEEGYLAMDLHDGDLTDKVTKDSSVEKIIYNVSDSSGNTETISRKLIREDNENPVITLKGNGTTYVTLNTKFNDPGYTALDNCDDDISDKVTVSGSVDTTKLGTYTLTYTVSDTKGNTDTKTRSVVVQKEYVRVSGNLTCGSPGVIYLTFDDGPNGYYTPVILDVLKKYNVKATFFVTSAGPDNMIKREYDEGHLVALHTSSHDYATVYKSSEAYFNDLNKVSERVERITGTKAKLIRFPGGSSNTVSRRYNSGIMTRLASEVAEKGYTYFDWNISSGDAGGLQSSTFQGKVDEEVSNVTRSLSKSRGNVVLMHDIKQTTANAIERIVKYGIDNGYKFDVLNSSIVCHQRINN